MAKLTLATAKERITELEKELKDGKTHAVTEPEKGFSIPEDITDPESKLIFALADLAGHVERLGENSHTGSGSGNFSYSFTSVFDMLDQVRPLLHERGLYMSGDMLIDSENYVRTKYSTSSHKEGVDLLLPVAWTVENYYGASKTKTFIGEARDTTDKATGKAFTASQKIALRSFCGLSTGDPMDTEQDHEERDFYAGTPPAKQGEPSRRPQGKFDENFGVCPIHNGIPFNPPTKNQVDKGFGASHSEGDGWCNYADVRQGHEAEVAPLIRAKFGDVETFITWMKTTEPDWMKRVKNAVGIGKFSGYRPQDWANLKDELEKMPDAQKPLEPDTPAQTPEEIAAEIAASKAPKTSMFCGETVGNPEAGLSCKLAPGHPDYMDHNSKPTISEIEDAKSAVEDAAGDN